MENHTDLFSKLLNMISEEEFRAFSISYGMRHPEMVEEMGKKYRKLLKGTQKIDIDKEIRACFVSFDYPDNFLEETDWSSTSKKIIRLLNRATAWAEGDNPQKATELGLKLLKAVLKDVWAEMEWNSDFYPSDEQCIEDIMSLLHTAVFNSLLSVSEKLAVADELDKICRMEALGYFYDDEDAVSSLAEEIRENYLSDDEYLAVLKRQYQDDTRSWGKDDKLREIWTFLVSHNRIEEAEALYHEHSETNALDESYGKMLENQQRDEEALKFYNDMTATQPNNYKWLWGIWRVHKRNGNYRGMLDALRKLFTDENNRLDSYNELKKLVTEDWDKELDGLIFNVYKEDGYDSYLGTILEKEQRFDQLCDRLLAMRSDPIAEILNYKKYFTQEQLSELALRMEHFIRRPLRNFEANRKGYQRIAHHIGLVATLGSTGKKVAKSTADYLLSSYSNRPALRDELRKAKLC